ncbi:conjugative transfer signal peptidase TraF [Pseudoduganella aquatica]|uniref:conjugative transfer signal peptidase TraF n=1 Tax=Pseudoduganella aquatica TaxID=2660641 RepID=UPI001E5B50C9|nr:conjugative transfer signal peptidase TraF [Pseudoduganella aquatica]
MKGLARKVGIGIAICALALLVQSVFLYLLGARVNTTLSIPVGLYWRVSEPVEKGAYVMFCPPPVEVFDQAKRRGYLGAGFCPGGYGYIMKQVAGVTDDQVEIGNDGVRINGRLLDMSAPLQADAGGRTMPRFQADRYVLSEHQLLLMGDSNPRSFDARYFGPVQRGQVKDVVTPVFTWGKPSKPER